MEIAILIVLILLLIVTILPLYMSMIAPKPLSALNFENDIQFLNFLIGTKLQHYNKYIVAPAKAAGQPLMTDEDLEKYRTGYVVEIYEHLSEQYQRTLLKYFSEEGLRFYIISTLNDEITSGILTHNYKYFNKTSGTSDDVTVHSVDM